MEGTHMKKLNSLLIAASAGLAVALLTGFPGLALGQESEALEAEDGEWAEDYDCTDEEDCEEDDEQHAEDDTGHPTPPEASATDDPSPAGTEAAGEPVLVTPGSTEESNPGGSTRPGTTPDN